MGKPKVETFQAQVEYRDPEKLTPYANNAKVHSTEQVDNIAAQIHRMGFDQPIVVDQFGVIIKGHGRREAALRLGLKRVPVIVRGDLDEHEAIAARIADNKVAEGQKYDEEKLRFDLGTLERNEFDMKLLAMDEGTIADLLKEPDFAPEGLDAQGKLDEKAKIQCPQCGCEFSK